MLTSFISPSPTLLTDAQLGPNPSHKHHTDFYTNLLIQFDEFDDFSNEFTAHKLHLWYFTAGSDTWFSTQSVTSDRW